MRQFKFDVNRLESLLAKSESLADARRTVGEKLRDAQYELKDIRDKRQALINKAAHSYPRHEPDTEALDIAEETLQTKVDTLISERESLEKDFAWLKPLADEAEKYARENGWDEDPRNYKLSKMRAA